MTTNEISLDYGYETEYISWMKQSPWGTQMMLGREFRITVGTTDDDRKPLQ
jgi:hypothetical protein